ncbi:hypothetical protein I6F35_02915 [Bradyrhizobium sp. BRP22]|uniref:DNA-primase RepB domain-containing protein n=1 Tax=Bradyrhizobium sp. BRP22 TaxID=2793821 RepID=UPI001CD302C1|nr:DNA-primase RepB domain-containing protein [Bradyrhizobium sp. BRP22]MCA1452166.1 hypothetical protein [Bradyrhizobium sp. BRP22]
MTIAVTFIHALFGVSTEHPVYLCSFPNERNDDTEPPERHVATRTPSHITAFAAKWDRAKRGLFFCAGTVKAGMRRAKENIVETPGLFVDIDFKNITETRDEVVRQLAKLRYPPTAVVASGGGLHCYWLFKEAFDTQSDIERIESALRQLADLVGGDLQCCEVSRVLRLPGSHNTKNDGWVEVEVIRLTEARYELGDLEEWLAEASPVILRKDRPQAVTAGQAADNPYLRYAIEHGYKPSLDVEKRLNAMMFMGGGESAIHATQIAVSASLLNAGEDIDDVVRLILEATRNAAGHYGARWNWRREEKNIRRMCETWLAKHPQKPKEAKPVPAPRDAGEQLGKLYQEQQDERASAASGGGAKILEFNKPAPPPSPPKPPKKELEHVVLGNIVLRMMHDAGEAVMFTAKAAWVYSHGIWELRIGTHWLDVKIEDACVVIGFKSKSKLIFETRSWIMRQPQLWRDGEIPWDAHRKIPTRSGLIDPDTLELTPTKPDDFCTWRIECDYDPKATCPWWQTMLNDTFADQAEETRKAYIRIVQELLGAALIDVKPRSQSKVLILQGISNVGKSEILEVLGGLFGDEINSTGLDALESAHGLMRFVRRVPWVLHEAFQPGKWHLSATVKAIITGEPVPINIKNGPLLSKRITVPIFWGANYAPQFKEATKAITNRIIVLICTREFVESEPLIGAAAEAKRCGYDKASALVLNTERPGLLNWAIAGLRAARKRGFIELTDAVRETAEEIRRDSNLAAGFIADCVEYDPERRISVPDFCAALAVWWVENKGEDRHVPSNDSIGRAMVALGDPRIAINRSELRETHRRYYAGIRLNDAGQGYWKRAVEGNLFEGKTASTTSPQGDPNGFIPGSWSAKPCVSSMRHAQKKKAATARRMTPDNDTDGSGTNDGSSTQASEGPDDPPF